MFGALVLGGVAVALFWWVTLENPEGEAVPASGGRYVEGVLRPPERVNPLFAATNSTDADLVALIYSGLVRLAPDGMPEPDLAERWEITNNGQRYVFHLRRGLAWHDGQAFSAEDVVFTYRAIADPGFKGDPSLAQLMQGVVVTARDPLTVEFQLEQTYAPFLAQLTAGILPRHLLRDLDATQLYNAAFNVQPIGMGPYRFIRRSEDGRVELEANSTYHFGPPRISDLELRVFSDERELLEALRSGGIDGALLGEDITNDELTPFASDSRWRTFELASARYYMLYLDTRSPLFDDRDVRRALFQTLNRDALLQNVAGGHGTLRGTGIPEGSWAWTGVEVPAFDPGAAATTMELEGFFRARDGVRSNADGERFVVSIATASEPRRAAIASDIARQWQAIGVSADIQALDPGSFVEEMVLPREYEVALLLVDPGVDPDQYPFWHSSQIPPPGLNLANYRDSRIDDTLERARQTTDVARRRDLYALFSGYLIASMPSIPLYAPSYVYVQSSRVHGFAPRLLYTSATRFAQTGDWYVETRVE
jgi:peptide/nickel transport system substrate-binding protein